MQRLLNFEQFINEASNAEIQSLITKLKGEADSEKQRIAGTADKLPWAMKFAVLNAFVNQLQQDMAAGLTTQPNYSEDLYNNIEGRSTQLKQDAINLLKQNGLSEEAAQKLNVTPSEEGTDQAQEQPVAEPQQTPPQPVQTEQPAPVQEAKNWSLVQIRPGTLKAEPKPQRQSKPKSPAEREFRTAFNHTRNEVRKIFNPKPEPSTPNSGTINPAPQQPQAPAVPPQQ